MSIFAKLTPILFWGFSLRKFLKTKILTLFKKSLKSPYSCIEEKNQRVVFAGFIVVSLWKNSPTKWRTFWLTTQMRHLQRYCVDPFLHTFPTNSCGDFHLSFLEKNRHKKSHNFCLILPKNFKKNIFRNFSNVLRDMLRKDFFLCVFTPWS